MDDKPSSRDATVVQPGEELWRHPDPTSTYMWHFLQKIKQDNKTLPLETYHDLHQWSIDHIADFWAAAWQYVGIRASRPYDEVGLFLVVTLSRDTHSYAQVVSDEAILYPRPSFFEGARLNFAENLLFPTQEVDPDSPAIIAATEVTRETVSWTQLRERVRQCRTGMLAANVRTGDRVAGFVANHTNALVAMLAATSIGAIWTAVSPDTGVTAVLDRMKQIEPVMLLCDNAVIYNGKVHPTLPKVEEIALSLPTLHSLVILETVPSCSSQISNTALTGKVVTYADFISTQRHNGPLEFEQLPPDHPVYILYSSGTTGAPKCIVHGAIGTLLQHKKEHVLQCDIHPGDRLFYFTTCTWMMWHWLVSGLASGATLILYDGSPFRYRDSLSQDESFPDDLAMPLSLIHI